MANLRLLANDYISFERTPRHITAQNVTLSLYVKGLYSSRSQLPQRAPLGRLDAVLRHRLALSPVFDRPHLRETRPHISEEQTLLLPIAHAGHAVLEQPKSNLRTRTRHTDMNYPGAA